MNIIIRTLVAAGVLALSAQATAQITFYEGEGFRGRAFSSQRALDDFSRTGFNDRAGSVVVDRGRWEVCEDSRYRGTCVILGPGSYNNLRGMRLGNRISSMRPADSRRRYDDMVPAPLREPDYAYRRRPNERTYEAQVTSVRAVLGEGNQHCWMERDDYDRYGRYEDSRRRGGSDTGRTLAGAIIGGILGHQIGSGSGRDAATVGGAVIGGAIANQSGRDRRDGRYDDRYDRGYERGMQRCETSYRGSPQYWDVSYEHRGVEHWVRMTDPPGDTIAVNRRGEPRQ